MGNEKYVLVRYFNEIIYENEYEVLTYEEVIDKYLIKKERVRELRVTILDGQLKEEEIEKLVLSYNEDYDHYFYSFLHQFDLI